MTSQEALPGPARQGQPSGAARAGDPATTLLKMLTAERRGRYSDRAVAGGLDRYLRGALTAAESGSLIFSAVAALPKQGYAALNTEQRAAWAEKAQQLLEGRSEKRRTSAAGSAPKRARAQRAAGGASGPAKRPTQRRPARWATGNTKQQDTASAADARGGLATPIAALGRVRATTIRKLEQVGVRSVGDLLWYFPHRHSDFRDVKTIASLVVGEEASIVGRVQSSRVAFMGRRIRASEVVIADESGKIRAVWFNQPYLVKQMPEGARIGLAGKISAYRKRLQFDSPEWERLDETESGNEDGTHVGRLVPIYPLTQGLPGRSVRRLARTALDRYLSLAPEALPPEVLAETGYLPAQEAIRQLHFPDHLEVRDAARERLAFEELLAIQLAVLQRKREARERRDAPLIRLSGDFLQRFVDALPFQLTNAQIRSLTEIRSDLAREEPMARLLQGDVGSGKTVVAAAAMLGAIAAGYQAALMAPTEILAEQHYRTFNRLFGGDAAGSVFHDYTVAPALGRPVHMALLTGSSSAARKVKLRDALQRGEMDIVVGTHALIQERVAMNRLGLAVVDEQHRFGVLQRDALRGKGGSPHLLVMTATPIPRTLALTIYGDLDVSQLDELPPGRQAITTVFAGPDERDGVYERIQREIEHGRQIFIICPLVEESEVVEAKAAVQEFERLRRDVFPAYAERMRLLHGRMSATDKEQAMADFRARRADILVSTAVVEVGVDVPNASVMLIEGADRFGLAQLHQFRGRVGRGEHASYCFLLSESPSARERLRLLERTGDGFALAEADLEQRGPGEYFGTRQSGLPDLRVATLTDHALLLKARNYAERILERDPNLRAPEHRTLAERSHRLSVAGAEAVH